MWVLFVNLSVVCLNHLLKVMNLFVQLSYLLVLYPSHLMLHSSWYQSVVTSAPCVIPVRITTATFPSHIRNICYANPPIRSFLQSLKLPLLLSFLFLLIKNMHLLPLLSLLTHQIQHVLILPLLQHFLFNYIKRVTELLQFLVPFYLPILWLVLLIP